MMQIPPSAMFVSQRWMMRQMITTTTIMHDHEPTARRRVVWEFGRVGVMLWPGYGDIIISSSSAAVTSPTPK